MRHVLCLLAVVFATLVLGAASLSSNEQRIFFEERQSLRLPFGYRLTEETNKANEQTRLTFALKLRNLDVLEETLFLVSTPHSPSYGKHLRQDAVIDMTSPHAEDVLRVVKWVESIAQRSVTFSDIEEARASGFLHVHASVEDAERMLNVEMHCFIHEHSHEKFWRAPNDRYSLPSSIASLIDFVGGVHRLPQRPVSDTRASQQALLPGNGPIITNLFPSSHEFTVLYFPRCSDGALMNTSTRSCVTSFSISVTYGQPLGVADQTNWRVSDGVGRCAPCSQFEGRQLSACTSALQSYGSTAYSTTIFCQSPALRGFPNYVDLSYSFWSTFSTGVDSTITEDSGLFLGEFMSPAVLRQRYGVPDGLYPSAETNSMSVAEFLGQYYAPGDLIAFFDLNGIVGPAPVVLIGPNNASLPGGEASLDIQYIMGIAPNITTTFWSLGQLHEGQEPFLDWIIDVLNSASPPLVHSVSYADDEDSLSLEYMLRIDAEFQKAGVRGLSIFFAAGDNGVASSDPTSPGCPGKFVPSFPSSSPHITAVSGTQWSTQWTPLCASTGDSGTLSYQCDTVEEIASSTLTGSRISTGGGFSNVFAQPAYQRSAVATYLDNYMPKYIPTSYYNASGRCYGDISSSARNYPTVIGGDIDSVDGTSAATPTIAALVALINDNLLLQGKSPVGFINPAIYSMPKTHFFDVVVGNNRCPEDLTFCCKYGYNASPLFDPLSGRGTPHFEELLHFFNTLQ